MIDVYTKGQGLRPDYGAIFADELTDMFFVCPNRAMARLDILRYIGDDVTQKVDSKAIYKRKALIYKNAIGTEVVIIFLFSDLLRLLQLILIKGFICTTTLMASKIAPAALHQFAEMLIIPRNKFLSGSQLKATSNTISH